MLQEVSKKRHVFKSHRHKDLVAKVVCGVGGDIGRHAEISRLLCWPFDVGEVLLGDPVLLAQDLQDPGVQNGPDPQLFPLEARSSSRANRSDLSSAGPVGSRTSSNIRSS